MKNARQAGYTLLEVILALAILGGAVAVLGEAASQAMSNARAARETARAQLLCEGKMAEIAADLIPMESGQGIAAPASDPNEPDWVYRIEKKSLEENGLYEVRVTVSQDLPKARRPASFTLVRWLTDPNAISSEAETSSRTSEGGGSQ